jgi:hypothetical protein
MSLVNISIRYTYKYEVNNIQKVGWILIVNRPCDDYSVLKEIRELSPTFKNIEIVKKESGTN